MPKTRRNCYEGLDPRLPRKVGYFAPLDPTVRRGFIYLTDKNHGLYVLEDAQREGT